MALLLLGTCAMTLESLHRRRVEAVHPSPRALEQGAEPLAYIHFILPTALPLPTLRPEVRMNPLAQLRRVSYFSPGCPRGTFCAEVCFWENTVEP